MIEVVNIRKEKRTPNDIYIGRGKGISGGINFQSLGNPYNFRPGKTKASFQVESREESILKYKEWIQAQLEVKDPEVRKALNYIYLKAKEGDINLVCHCSPASCHGDIIKELIEKTINENKSE